MKGCRRMFFCFTQSNCNYTFHHEWHLMRNSPRTEVIDWVRRSGKSTYRSSINHKFSPTAKLSFHRDAKSQRKTVTSISLSPETTPASSLSSKGAYLWEQLQSTRRDGRLANPWFPSLWYDYPSRSCLFFQWFPSVCHGHRVESGKFNTPFGELNIAVASCPLSSIDQMRSVDSLSKRDDRPSSPTIDLFLFI